MTDSEAVGQYFAELRNNGGSSLERLCSAFYDRLAAVARRKFGDFPRRVTDEYAVANSALQAFHQRAQRGEFSELREPAELLLILSQLTRDRVVDEIRRQTAQKRGGGTTRGNSIFVPLNNRDSAVGSFDRFEAAHETPSKQEMATEELQRLLKKLQDPMLGTILVLRYEGLTNQEIAEQLQVSIATVERKRRRIRELLADDYPDEVNAT